MSTDNEKVQNSKVLCRLRWAYPIVNFGQQAVRQCCRTPMFKLSTEDIEKYKESVFLNHPYHQERRREMLNDVRHSDCSTCWNLESDHMMSPRESFSNLEQLNFLSGGEDDKNRVLAHKPWMLDIELSNLCDLKCMYCNRMFSSSWASEDLKLNRISRDQYQRENQVASENFEKYFWEWFLTVKDYLVHLNFIGGEPTINPNYYKYLEKIKSAYEFRENRKLYLVTVSNFNAAPEIFDKFLDSVQNLTGLFNVDIDASQESMGGRSEFIRYGLKWENWERNVHAILAKKMSHFTLSIQSAVNLLSLKSSPEFFEKIATIRDQHNVPIFLKTNIVSYPNHLSPIIGTVDMAEDLKRAAAVVRKHVRDDMESSSARYRSFNWSSYSDFLLNLADSIIKKQSDTNYLLVERAKFYDWLKQYEKTRNVVFLDVFPEYAEFYDLCEKAYRSQKK